MRIAILAVTMVAASVSFASVSVAHAGDIMASRYGNTTITRDAAGHESHIYYKADHSFTGKQGDAEFSGTWAIKGSTICLTAVHPIPGTPNPACAPISEHKVGDTWKAGPYTVSIVAGIH
jgi:hypothetical protein